MTEDQKKAEEISNKDQAVGFLKQVAEGLVKEAYQTYVSGDLIHHNLYFQGDAVSLRTAMEEDAAANPHKQLEVKRVVEEEDIVVVHSHIQQQAEESGVTVVHMMRFENGQIVELWDIGQPIPEDSPNEYGPF